MSIVERVIFSFRRAGALIFRNVWLLVWAVLYSFLGPVLILGGTGLPVLWWWLSGRYFEPSLLFSDPLAFILSHATMILISLAGFTLGFTVYLVVLLFYHGALTGVAVRGLAPGGGGAEKVSASSFWYEGKSMFAASMSSATLASLLPLVPFAVMLLPVMALAFKLAALVTGELSFSTPWVIFSIVAAVLTGLLTALCCWIAFLWYQFALAASRVEGVSGGSALGRAWSLVIARPGVVACFVISLIVIYACSWGVTAPFSLGGKLLRGSLLPLGIALQVVAMPLSLVLNLFVELWTKCALVALYVDNRAELQPSVEN